MPTHTMRITPGIYAVEWNGHVAIEEIFAAKDRIQVFVNEDHCDRFVVIIDATTSQSLPFDLHLLTKTIIEGTIGFLVLHPPLAAEIIGRMFNALMSVKAEFFQEREEMMERAYAMLDAEIPLE